MKGYMNVECTHSHNPNLENKPIDDSVLCGFKNHMKTCSVNHHVWLLVLAIPFEPHLKFTWVFNLTIGNRVEKSIQHCLILAHVCNFESNTAQPAKNVRQCSSKLAERACYELLHQGETLGNIPCDSNIMKWGCKKASLSIHGVLKLYSSEATLFPSNSFCMCSSLF